MQLWLASCLDAYYIHCIGAGVGSVWNRVGSASRGFQRCEDPVSGAGGVQLWVSRPLIEAKVAVRPTFLPRAHITQHNLLTEDHFVLTSTLFTKWQLSGGDFDKWRPARRPSRSNGWRPGGFDEERRWVSKFPISFEDEMVSVDKDDEAVNVYYMKNQIDESQKLALCQWCS